MKKRTLQILTLVGLIMGVLFTPDRLEAAVPFFDGIKLRVAQSKVSQDSMSLSGIYANGSATTGKSDWETAFPFVLVFRGSRLLDSLNLDVVFFYDFQLDKEMVITSRVDGNSYSTPAESQYQATYAEDAFYLTRINISTLMFGAALSSYIGGKDHHFFKVSLGLVAGIVYYDGTMSLCRKDTSSDPCVDPIFIEDNADFNSVPGLGGVYSLTLYEWSGQDYSLSLVAFEKTSFNSEIEFKLDQKTRPSGEHKIKYMTTFTNQELLSFTLWF